MEETTTACSTVVRKLEWKSSLARPRHRWKLIKTSLLKPLFSKQNVSGLSGRERKHGRGPVADWCEHGKETLRFQKRWGGV